MIAVVFLPVLAAWAGFAAGFGLCALGVVAVLATTGAPMASRMPVTLGEVEMIRTGFAGKVSVPAAWMTVRGQSAAWAGGEDTTKSAMRQAARPRGAATTNGRRRGLDRCIGMVAWR